MSARSNLMRTASKNPQKKIGDFPIICSFSDPVVFGWVTRQAPGGGS